jgi:hypothetical protein
MSKRDRELIWPFRNLEDILWPPGLRKLFVNSKGICVPSLRAAQRAHTVCDEQHGDVANAAAELMAAATATSLSLFNAAVASFSTNTRGRRTSVRVIATRARCPRRVLVLVLPQRFRPRLVDPVSCHGCCCARRFLDLAHGCGLRHRIEDVGRNCPVEECWILWHSSNIRAQPRNV